MKPQLKISKGNLQVWNDTLIYGQPHTYLSASIASGVSTFTVDDTSAFAVSKYFLIGNFGDPDAEIVLTHASTTPSGSTITLAAATTKTHTESDKVTLIDFNQVLYERATTSGGSQSALATQDIDPTLKYSLYNDETNTTGYGYSTFKNVIAGNTFSEESVEVPYTGYTKDTVGKIIIDVYEQLGLDPNFDYGIDEVNACLDDISSRKKRWTPQRVLNEDIGDMSDLSYAFTLPTAIREDDNGNSIIEVRLGNKATPLDWLDYQMFKLNMNDAKLTTLNGAASATDTTITLTDSGDFDESGSISIPGQDDDVTYTSNVESTGVLSGVPASGDGAISATLADGANVWQDQDEGEPEYFTINSSGQLLIYPLPDSNWIEKNIFIDYYAYVTAVDDLADTIDVHRYNLVKMWLIWKVRGKEENNGVTSLNDPDFQRYLEAVEREKRFDKGDKLFIFKNVRDMAVSGVEGFDLEGYNRTN